MANVIIRNLARGDTPVPSPDDPGLPGLAGPPGPGYPDEVDGMQHNKEVDKNGNS